MEKVYIYDLEKVYFYIENGIRPLEVPREHYKTHRVAFCFSKQETEALYKKWLERNK